MDFLRTHATRIMLSIASLLSFSGISHGQEKSFKCDFEDKSTEDWKEFKVYINQPVAIKLLDETDNHFLHLECGDKVESVFIHSFDKIELKPGMKLRWRWRMVDAIPHKSPPFTQWGNFPSKIYLYLDHQPGPETGPALSYMWSLKLVMAKWDHSPNPAPHRYLTIEHGIQKKGEWIQEERDLYEDAVKAFDKILPAPPRYITAIGIAIAVLGEGGSSSFDYDDFEIMQQ